MYVYELIENVLIQVVVQVVQRIFGAAIFLHRRNQRRRRCCYPGSEDDQKYFECSTKPTYGSNEKIYG